MSNSRSSTSLDHHPVPLDLDDLHPGSRLNIVTFGYHVHKRIAKLRFPGGP